MKTISTQLSRPLACASALAAAVILTSSTGHRSQAPDGAAGIEDTRTILEEWVETRRAISKERRDWVLGREMLTERIELVQEEIDAFGIKISEVLAKTEEADAKVDELVDQRDRLEATSAALEQSVAALEGRTRGLLVRLPEVLRERVRPLSQRIPGEVEGGEPKRLSVSQRFESIVGVLNEVNRFNREISATSEVRTLEDGTAVEVTALYVGIAQGYYVNATGTAAGYGFGAEDGWTWRADDASAAAIATAVAITKGEQAAEFVQLPIRIQ